MSTIQAVDYSEIVYGYGSNLSWRLLRNRLNDGEWADDGWYKTGRPVGPDPIDLGIARLSNYRFKYNLWESPFLDPQPPEIQTAGNIVVDDGDEVYGAIYQITPEQLTILDKDEDEGVAYTRMALKLQKVVFDALGIPNYKEIVEAWCYVGNPDYVVSDDEIAPDPDYVDHVVQYAEERHLPSDYIDNRLRYDVPVGG